MCGIKSWLLFCNMMTDLYLVGWYLVLEVWYPPGPSNLHDDNYDGS